ncbi:MAG: hypothetical protein HGA78_10365, partial [Nitrospirales bacterium]|nr:hypothetical protein [Nitrospirales bacterium]
LSGDKDMMQVVGNGIRIYDPMKELVIDADAVQERFGLPPERVPEVMAIMGDAADNIPGVKGIGEKTAKDLLREAGSLGELLEHPEKIKSERLRRMISESKEMIALSKTLVTIDTDLPLELEIRDLLLKEPDWQRLLDLFTEFEFRNLIKLVPNQGHRQRGKYWTISTQQALKEFLKG